MEKSKLMLLLETSPDQILGGYLPGRIQFWTEQFEGMGWSVQIGAPTKMEEYKGIPCEPIRTKTLVKGIANADLVICFLSTNPHWVQLVRSAGIPLILDATNIPWLERAVVHGQSRSSLERSLSRCNHELMDWMIRAAQFAVVSHGKQGEYLLARNPSIRLLRIPHLNHATPDLSHGLNRVRKHFILGGGLWPWFDYDTLFHGILEYHSLGGEAKVILPVGKSEYLAFQKIVLGRIEANPVLRQHVQVLDRWLPQEEWLEICAEAVAGLNCQPDTPETRHSFRTRVADYLRLGLPVLTTEGDYLAELVLGRGAGLVHGFGDAHLLAKHMRQIEMGGQPWEKMRDSAKALYGSLCEDAQSARRALPGLVQDAVAASKERASWITGTGIAFLLAKRTLYEQISKLGIFKRKDST